jgi:hypothetical protein
MVLELLLLSKCSAEVNEFPPLTRSLSDLDTRILLWRQKYLNQASYMLCDPWTRPVDSSYANLFCRNGAFQYMLALEMLD